MASLDTLEKGIEGSRPIEIYAFVLGGEPFRFTSAEDDITLGIDVYTAEPISRSSVAQGSDERNRLLKITLPVTNSFAAKYIAIPPGEIATLTISRLQRDETPTFNTTVQVFKGELGPINYPDDLTVVLGFYSQAAKLSRTIPRFTFQSSCNHVLYDSRCKVNSALFKLANAAVTAESGNDITVTGAGISSFDFTGGFVKPDGIADFRLVIKQVGDVLTLLLPFSGGGVNGLNVTVFAGCDHDINGDCSLVFNNVIDYGGHAFIPNKDIFSTNLQNS